MAEAAIDPIKFRRQKAFDMSEYSTALSLDPVIQLSVFAENRVGRLYDLTKVLQKHNVHIVALTVLDTTDSSILRLIVDDTDTARELMIKHDFPFSETTVVAVEIEGEHRIKAVLGALFEAEINIHYVYSFIQRPSGKSGLVIRAEDPDDAADALNRSGFSVLTHADIAR